MFFNGLHMWKPNAFITLLQWTHILNGAILFLHEEQSIARHLSQQIVNVVFTSKVSQYFKLDITKTIVSSWIEFSPRLIHSTLHMSAIAADFIYSLSVDVQMLA